MKLTPLDIRHKEFKRGMRGYVDVEVDEFLDEIADEYERLFKENIDLQDRLEALEEKVAGYKRIEDTLQKTLVNAQASAEEQKQNASKQAQLVLQDAELKARQMVNEAYSERQAIEQSVAELRGAEEDFRFKFKTMMEGYLRQLRETQPAAAGPSDADQGGEFARQAEAIKRAIARESTPGETKGHEPGAAAAAAEVAVGTPGSAEPHIPEAPVVAPARGRGGVQAGSPRREARVDAAGTTAGRPSRAAADDPETTAAGPSPRDRDQHEGARERVVLGESDDLLADVDAGVNENEFQW